MTRMISAIMCPDTLRRAEQVENSSALSVIMKMHHEGRSVSYVRMENTFPRISFVKSWKINHNLIAEVRSVKRGQVAATR